MDGTANEKERRPFADRISGTVGKNQKSTETEVTTESNFMGRPIYYVRTGRGGGVKTP